MPRELPVVSYPEVGEVYANVDKEDDGKESKHNLWMTPYEI